MIVASRIISYLFHPLLVPTYLFLLLAFVFPAGLDPVPSGSHLLFIALIFMVTFAIPLLMVGLLKSFGIVKSMQMATREERVIPFLVTAVIYCFVTYMFYSKTRIGLNDNFMKIMMIIDLLVLVGTIITFKSKISIHSVGAWGVIGILIPLNKLTELDTLFYPTLAVIVLTGIVMSARLQLGAHTLKQVLWGSVVGLATSITGMLFLFQ